jgi:hypothetical protein
MNSSKAKTNDHVRRCIISSRAAVQKKKMYNPLVGKYETVFDAANVEEHRKFPARGGYTRTTYTYSTTESRCNFPGI